MVLEVQAPKAKETTAEVLKNPRSYSETIEKKESYRESKKNQMAVSIVHSTKKRLCGGTTDSGSFSVKQIHKLSNIQDVDLTRGKTASSPRILDNLSRPKRRLLAHSNSTKQKTLPRFQVQKPKLAVSGYALWPKCGSPLFYQGNGTHGKLASSGGNMVPTVLGRFPYHRTNQGTVSSSQPKSNRNHTELRPYNKHGKITSNTITELRMVRDPMGSADIHCSSYTKKISAPSRTTNINSACPTLYKTYNNEASRLSKLDWSVRSSSQTSNIYNEDHFKILQNSSSRHQNRNSKKSKNATVQLDNKPDISSTSGISHSRLHNSNGCFSKRVGFSDQPNPVSWNIRPNNDLFNQHPGTINNLVCIDDYPRQRSCNTSYLRQLHSVTSIKEGRINEFSPSLYSRVDLEESGTVQMDSETVTHSRELQCSSRPAFQKLNAVNRVGNYSPGLPKDSQIKPTSTSGPLCNKTQQQIGCLHFTVPRSRATAMDALTTSWERWDHLYLYPPTPLISKVLAKMTNTKFMSALFLTPEMPTRPWYMALKLQKYHQHLWKYNCTK